MNEQNTKALAPYEGDLDSVIVIEQLPVIREQLELLRDHITRDVKTALSLACTEATVKDVKAIRAKLSKDFKLLESKRIEAKKRILAPYEQFDKIYRECVTAVYGHADAMLKKKVDDVEGGLKEAKRADLYAYFRELCRYHGITFLTLERTGVSVTLSASLKALKSDCKAFVDQVAADLAFISQQEHAAEILAEYRKSLSAVSAMQAISDRHKAIQEEQERLVRAKEEEEERARAAQAVSDVLREEAPAPEIAAPLASPSAEPIEDMPMAPEEPRYTITLRVTATKEQLVALKKFLREGIYDYE
jgi:hypothetical protein